MSMKSITRCLLLSGAISILASTITSAASAQQPSGGRRTDFEYLEKGFDLDGLTPQGYPKFADTPELRAKYEQAQLKRLQENVEKLSKLGKEDWVTEYDSTSDGKTRRKLKNMAEDLEKVTKEMIKFFDWRFQLAPLDIDGPAEGSVRERVAKIAPMVEQILKTIPVLAGDGIPVKEFVEMRQNLARIQLLTRTLRN